MYKGFLDELHFHGILKIADVDKIFANLSELCEVHVCMIVMQLGWSLIGLISTNEQFCKLFYCS